jgi:predicted RNA binding protein YcfA (HicA-like mRNA interferase family)
MRNAQRASERAVSCAHFALTVASAGNDDLAPGTLNSILKQAGLKTPGQE